MRVDEMNDGGGMENGVRMCDGKGADGTGSGWTMSGKKIE